MQAADPNRHLSEERGRLKNNVKWSLLPNRDFPFPLPTSGTIHRRHFFPVK